MDKDFNLLTELRIRPDSVDISLDLDTQRQFLRIKYEWKGKLGALSQFLVDVRADLEAHGFSVTQIDLGAVGITFGAIKPESDPDGMAFPSFSVKRTAQFQQEHEDFLEIARHLRRRMRGDTG